MNSKNLLLDRSEQNIRIKQTSGARHVAYNSSTWEAEAAGLWIQGQLHLHSNNLLKKKSKKEEKCLKAHQGKKSQITFKNNTLHPTS